MERHEVSRRCPLPAFTRRSAYHEAGHAVAAAVLGIEVMSASIEWKSVSDSMTSTGLVRFQHRPVPQRLSRQARTALHRQRLVDDTILSLAGFAAVDRLEQRTTERWGSLGDLVKAEGNIAILGRSPDSEVALWHFCLAEAASLVETNWPKVESMAEALLAHITLDARAIAGLIRTTEAQQRAAWRASRQHGLAPSRGEIAALVRKDRQAVRALLPPDIRDILNSGIPSLRCARQ